LISVQREHVTERVHLSVRHVWPYQQLDQCFPNFSTSRYPWPRSSYLLEENTYFF
jgi:hypothetical protein